MHFISVAFFKAIKALKIEKKSITLQADAIYF